MNRELSIGADQPCLPPGREMPGGLDRVGLFTWTTVAAALAILLASLFER